MLTQDTSVSAGDWFVKWSSGNGDWRGVALADIITYLNANLAFPPARPAFTTQYAAPSATLFNIAITDGDESIHLILTPLAGYANGTVTLPPKASCVDKQEVLVNCTQAVTTLAVAGNGSTVTGAPTTLTANAFFCLKFDAVTSTWYRVG
jgi:hypothetical protein